MKKLAALILALGVALVTVPASADTTGGPGTPKPVNDGDRNGGKGGCTKLGC